MRQPNSYLELKDCCGQQCMGCDKKISVFYIFIYFFFINNYFVPFKVNPLGYNTLMPAFFPILAILTGILMGYCAISKYAIKHGMQHQDYCRKLPWYGRNGFGTVRYRLLGGRTFEELVGFIRSSERFSQIMTRELTSHWVTQWAICVTAWSCLWMANCSLT